MMKSFRIATWAMALTATLLVAGCQRAATKGEEKITLQLSMKKGKTYDYDTKMNMTMFMMGQTMVMSSGTGYKMTVTEARQDEQVIECSYSRFKMDLPMMPGMSFDSEKPDPNNPMSKKFSEIRGAKFTFVLTSAGRVKDIKGLKEIAEKVGDDQVLSQMLSEETFSNQMGQYFNYFPTKMVGVGDSWQSSMSVASQLPMTSTNTFTLKSMTRDKVVLDVSGVIQSDAGDASPEMEGVTVSGTTKGTMELEKESGFTLASQMDMDATAKKDGGELVKLKMTSTTTGKVK